MSRIGAENAEIGDDVGREIRFRFTHSAVKYDRRGRQIQKKRSSSLGKKRKKKRKQRGGRMCTSDDI